MKIGKHRFKIIETTENILNQIESREEHQNRGQITKSKKSTWNTERTKLNGYLRCRHRKKQTIILVK